MLFERCGLEKIGHEATAEVVRGGSLWARWWQETFDALRTWEKGKGSLTEDREKEYKVLTAPWTDPSFWFINPLIHACWGQRPAHSSERLRCSCLGLLADDLQLLLLHLPPARFAIPASAECDLARSCKKFPQSGKPRC